jgi:CRP-like cAMP-binding protein
LRIIARDKLIFSQGDDCTTVLYLQQGTVKLTIVSPVGKEAVIAILYPGDFFGEGCIAGQPRRVARAVAVQSASVLAINKKESDP